MYVKSLKIENLRCFASAELELQHPDRKDADIAAPAMSNINLLLGMNGAGKTTTLKALALATLSPVIAQSGYVPYHLVRRTGPSDTKNQEASISVEVLLHPQDASTAVLAAASTTQRLTTKVKRHGDTESLLSENLPSDPSAQGGIWQNMYFEKSPAFLVVGYGATRRVEDTGNFDVSAQSKARLLRYQRVAGLFESAVALRPLGSWLPDFKKENPGRYTQAVHLIDKLLPEEAKFSGLFESGEYLFHLGRTKVPFGAMSDGYRAYIGWIADLLYHICMGAPKGAKLIDNRGLVLVDEIDLHLHPEWQRSIISIISETLPKLQFVFSTHSPIVAGSLHKENIFVMETKPDGSSAVRKFEERIYGRDAEQVLTSSYFNLKTTRAPGFVDELQALSKKANVSNPEVSLAIMQKLSGEEPPAASSDGNSARAATAAAKGRKASKRAAKSAKTSKRASKKRSSSSRRK